MTEIYPYDAETLARLVAEADAVEQAVRESAQEAMVMHKRLGNPVATWRDGKVVWIPAEEIPIDAG